MIELLHKKGKLVPTKYSCQSGLNGQTVAIQTDFSIVLIKMVLVSIYYILLLSEPTVIVDRLSS